jgi:hypothetical protein
MKLTARFPYGSSAPQLMPVFDRLCENAPLS